MAYYEEDVLQDNAHSPQESSPPALFFFRSIARLKSQKAPESVTYEEAYYIQKELLSLLIYHDRTCVRMEIKGVG